MCDKMWESECWKIKKREDGSCQKCALVSFIKHSMKRQRRAKKLQFLPHTQMLFFLSNDRKLYETYVWLTWQPRDRSGLLRICDFKVGSGGGRKHYRVLGSPASFLLKKLRENSNPGLDITFWCGAKKNH